MKGFFSSCGQVTDARIAKDAEGNSRGFGHVEFTNADAVKKAMLKVGENIDGRPIKVDVATKRDGGSGGK